MRKKLTVYSDEEVIKKAKIIAIENNLSLSDIIECLLSNLSNKINDKTLLDICLDIKK